jgi:hypothetical protein
METGVTEVKNLEKLDRKLKFDEQAYDLIAEQELKRGTNSLLTPKIEMRG